MSGRTALVALALIATGAAIPAYACNQHLLVSGYFSNNVAIYDACNGRFLRQLDQASRIRGAQAVRLNPADDLIYVVSEGNDQIQRYRHDDYSFVDVFAQFAGNIDPDGLAFGLDGRVYVASYGTSSVLELDRHTGQVIGSVLPNGSGLVGADNGMMVSAAGLLYVPGYDSNTVARVNPANGQVQGTFVAAGAGGLVNTRGIVDEGDTILVGGEGSGSVYRFNASTGALVGTLASGFSRPTGMTLAANGELLVLAGNRVRRIDRGSGAELGTLANGADGGISGGTFIALVSAQETGAGNMPIGSGFTGTWVDAGATGQLGLGLEVLAGGNLVAEVYTFAPAGGQAWIGGVGPIIDGDHATITVSTINGPGGRFAPNFDPSQVTNRNWGTLSLRFSDCNHGTLDWASSVPGYGSGSLPIIRVTLPAGLSCP
jgi:outer membrane protein assembly factor BamB